MISGWTKLLLILFGTLLTLSTIIGFFYLGKALSVTGYIDSWLPLYRYLLLVVYSVALIFALAVFIRRIAKWVPAT